MSKLLLLCGACAVISTVPSTTLAQTWPERPVRVVVPWAPGGITDILARLVAERLTQSFGQPFIVDNRAGVAGNIGAELVARAAADGHTLMVTNPGAFATNQFLYQHMAYKPADFTGVILLGQFPNALMVYRDLPVKSVADLIAYAKKNPTALNGASSGSGTSGHLSLEMFKALTGTQKPNAGGRSSQLRASSPNEGGRGMSTAGKIGTVTAAASRMDRAGAPRCPWMAAARRRLAGASAYAENNV